MTLRLQPFDRPAVLVRRPPTPAAFGPKAANLARLGRAGLPIPDGFCLAADAYRHQVAALGLEAVRARGLRQQTIRRRRGSARCR